MTSAWIFNAISARHADPIVTFLPLPLYLFFRLYINPTFSFLATILTQLFTFLLPPQNLQDHIALCTGGCQLAARLSAVHGGVR